MNIKNYIWITPFCSFILGYAVATWLFYVDSIPAPHIVGKQLHEALPIISNTQLNLRLINQKEEKDLPEGIILNQTPTPGSAIKPHQPIFIVVTKKPTSLSTPQCIEKNIDVLIPELHKRGIHPRIYMLNHAYPAHMCFAQSPEPHEPLENNKLVLYVSSGNNKPIIWPNFMGHSYDRVQEFLSHYSIDPYVIDNSTNHDTKIVIDQRPLAGTLLTITPEQPLSVQLRLH